MSIYSRLMLLFAVAPLLTALAANLPKTQHQPLEAVPELIGMRYCYGDVETFSIRLRLRVKYINRSATPVILDREIGKRWYGEKVARNLKDLAAGNYEYNPNVDWFFTDKDKLPGRPSTHSPGPDFAVVAPGQAFESEIEPTIIAQYDNLKAIPDLVRPGVHVFQMELSAWNHPGDASEFAKSWRQFGDLATGVIRTELLQIRIPSNPKIERNCK